VLHVEVTNNDSLLLTQDYDSGKQSRIIPLQSFWFIKIDQLGKLSVGRQSQASDNTAILVDGSGSLVPANWVAFDYNSFFVREATGSAGSTGIRFGGAGGCTGGGAIGDCNGVTQNVVRYDSPSFGGFSVSASWGEDDMWDVAARYAGEFNGFKLAVAAAYNELSDSASFGSYFTVPVGDTYQYFQVGAYLEHVPTGVFVYGAYGNAQYDIATGESETYYVKAGLRERWVPLGHTVLYGEYENNQADGNAFVQSNLTGGNAGIRSSDFDLWGLGVVQEIDAAAMSLWVSYRHIEYDDNSTNDYEDFQYIKAGALINF
jgi:predicted porin